MSVSSNAEETAGRRDPWGSKLSTRVGGNLWRPMALLQSPLALKGAEVPDLCPPEARSLHYAWDREIIKGRSAICFGESLKQNKFVYILSKLQLKSISQSPFFLWEKPLN